MPSPGYKSPRNVKGLHFSGLKMINVSSVDNLTVIKKENEGIIVARNVGMKKQHEILKKAKELDIKVLNLNADGQIKKIEDIINSKKKKDTKEKKAEAKEEKEKKAKEESEKETKKDKNSVEKQVEDDRKEAEKKEKDRLLTKKVW